MKLRYQTSSRFKSLGWREHTVLVLIAIVVLSSCSSDTTPTGESPTPNEPTGATSEAGTEEASALLAEDEAEVSWTAPGPAFDAGTRLEGKSLCTVSITLANPFGEAIINGATEAADALGMSVIPQDASGSVSEANRLMDQCIARKASVIVVHSFPTSSITAAIQKADEAGIPVIQMFEGLGPVPQEDADVGVAARVSFDYADAGRRVAHFVAADSGCDANVVVFDVPEIAVSALEVGGFVDELARLCPDAQTEVVPAPVAQWQTGLQNITSSALQSDPTVNYLFPLYDGMVTFVKPAVIQQNRQDSVKIVSYNASLPNMEAVGTPDDPEVAAIGGSNTWMGWASVDQAARVLLGLAPFDNPNVPHRTFTHNNIDSIDLQAPESEWYGASIDFRTEFMNLWGLS